MSTISFLKINISKSITLIRSLNPKPGESYSFDETIQNSPDVIVSKGRKGWVVELNKSTLPAVVIDENYISELSSKSRKLISAALSSSVACALNSCKVLFPGSPLMVSFIKTKAFW